MVKSFQKVQKLGKKSGLNLVKNHTFKGKNERSAPPPLINSHTRTTQEKYLTKNYNLRPNSKHKIQAIIKNIKDEDTNNNSIIHEKAPAHLIKI